MTNIYTRPIPRIKRLPSIPDTRIYRISEEMRLSKLPLTSDQLKEIDERKRKEKKARRAENKRRKKEASLSGPEYLSYSRGMDAEHQSTALKIFISLIKEEIGEPLCAELIAEASQQALFAIEDNMKQVESEYFRKANRAPLSDDKRDYFRSAYLLGKRLEFYAKHGHNGSLGK